MMPTPAEVMTMAVAAVTESAAHYGVTDAQVAELCDRIDREPAYAAGYMDGNLTAHLVQIANDHYVDCDADNCRTCDSIRKALMIRLADMTTDPEKRRPRMVFWPGQN